jgi:hypothetical protein
MTANQLDASSISESMAVLLMYGLMWGVGLLMISVNLFKQRSRSSLERGAKQEQQTGTRIPNQSKGSDSRSQPDDVRRMLTKYIDEIFPTVFQSQSYFRRMMAEVMKHHRYIVLLTSRGEDLNTKKIITCIHLLTVQSMLMFILAVLYDLQVCLDLYLASPFDTDLVVSEQWSDLQLLRDSGNLFERDDPI